MSRIVSAAEAATTLPFGKQQQRRPAELAAAASARATRPAGAAAAASRPELAAHQVGAEDGVRHRDWSRHRWHEMPRRALGIASFWEVPSVAMLILVGAWLRSLYKRVLRLANKAMQITPEPLCAWRRPSYCWTCFVVCVAPGNDALAALEHYRIASE